MRVSYGRRDWDAGQGLNGQIASHTLASSEERASTPATTPIVQTRKARWTPGSLSNRVGSPEGGRTVGFAFFRLQGACQLVFSLSNILPAPKPTSFRACPGIQFYLYMDPGSKSPRGLGDVRDDVCSVLPPMSCTSFRA